MIFRDFGRALKQLPDPNFRAVLLLGIGLTIGLLASICVLFLIALQIVVPDAIELPWLGSFGGLQAILSWTSILVMLILSVFLMVPVASVFTGFFLERVAVAVEARFYPHLPPAPGLGTWESIKDSLNFISILVLINLVALIASFWLGPFVPIVFWCVNGYLLGREYFTLAAARRIGLEPARRLRNRHKWSIFVAGVLMAIPLSVPILSLVIPVLGAATFTHMYHRLTGTPVSAL